MAANLVIWGKSAFKQEFLIFTAQSSACVALKHLNRGGGGAPVAHLLSASWVPTAIVILSFSLSLWLLLYNKGKKCQK